MAFNLIVMQEFLIKAAGYTKETAILWNQSQSLIPNTDDYVMIQYIGSVDRGSPREYLADGITVSGPVIVIESLISNRVQLDVYFRSNPAKVDPVTAQQKVYFLKNLFYSTIGNQYMSDLGFRCSGVTIPSNLTIPSDANEKYKERWQFDVILDFTTRSEIPVDIITEVDVNVNQVQ